MLKSGGVLLATAPAYQWLWSGHDEALGHRRRYTRRGLSTDICRAGFRVQYAGYFIFFLFPAIALFRFYKKLFSNTRASHLVPFPRILNRVVLWQTAGEAALCAAGVRSPFGSSVAAVAEKA